MFYKDYVRITVMKKGNECASKMIQMAVCTRKAGLLAGNSKVQMVMIT